MLHCHIIVTCNNILNLSCILYNYSTVSTNGLQLFFVYISAQLLEDDYEDFESLENVEKSFYKFDGLLALVKEYIVDVWEIRKHKLYDSDSGSGLQLHFQSSTGERSGKFSQNGK